VTASTVWHIGIVVEDIQVAIADFSELFGLHFAEPLTYAADIEDLGQRATKEMTFVYSDEGPPYLELIQAQPTGLWSPQYQGLHHIGVWQEGFEAQAASLLQLGHRADARVFRPDGTLSVLYLDTDHPHVHGTRIELMVPGPITRRHPPG